MHSENTEAKSRVITLDEMGTFEDRARGVRFVGGFVGDVDYEKEKTQIESFLRDDVCQKLSRELKQEGKIPENSEVRYPQGLHGSDDALYEKKLMKKTQTMFGKEVEVEVETWNKVAVDSSVSWEIKRNIQNQVMKYLEENDYRYFMYLDPHVGNGKKVYDDSKGATNILDETQGAVRYERMAVQALYHQIFYSMDAEPEEYIFELATRTLPMDRENLERELKKVEGMYTINADRVYITDTSTYKTAIATKLYEQNIDSKAMYKFYVAPINYQGEDGKKPTTPYTYMADILCGYLRQLLQNEFEIHFGIKENVITSEGLIELFNRVNKDKMIFDIHVYSKADAIYRKMVDCVKNHDLVKYYDYMYKLMEMVRYDDKERNYSKFYLNTWVEQLNEKIKHELSTDTEYRRMFISMAEDYIVAAEGYMGKREIAYEKGSFIAEKLRECFENMKEETIHSQFALDRRNCALFKLYDIILRGNNHRGAVEVVAQCIEKCDEYKAYVSVEDYAAHILRRVVFYYNMCDFRAALEISKKLEKIGVQLENIYRDIHTGFDEMYAGRASISSVKASLVGKIYSNLGQAYAFCSEFGDSGAAFANALDRFAEDSGDYKITMSYYLHLLIEHGRQTDYELNAKSYFGADTLEGQLRNVIASNNPFTLFVFAKAFNRFYANDIVNRDIFDEMYSYVYGKVAIERNSHPWELIFKQLGECMWKLAKKLDAEDDKEAADKYMKLAITVCMPRCYGCVKKADTTIVLIVLNARLQFEDMFDKAIYDSDGIRIVELNDKAGEDERREFIACEEVFKVSGFESYRVETKEDGEKVKIVAYDELKSKLDELMTYMYH